jgi:hypothetical protein
MALLWSLLPSVGSPALDGLFSAAGLGVAALASVLGIGAVMRGATLRGLGFRAGAGLGWFGAAAGLGLALALIRVGLPVALFQLVVRLSPEAILAAGKAPDTGGETGAAVPAALAVSLAAVIVAALWEELLFRGFLFRWLRGSLTLWPAALFSAAFYGLWQFDPIQAVSGFAAGMAAAWLFERSGSLWPPVVMNLANGLLAVGIGELALRLFAG